MFCLLFQDCTIFNNLCSYSDYQDFTPHPLDPNNKILWLLTWSFRSWWFRGVQVLIFVCILEPSVLFGGAKAIMKGPGILPSEKLHLSGEMNYKTFWKLKKKKITTFFLYVEREYGWREYLLRVLLMLKTLYVCSVQVYNELVEQLWVVATWTIEKKMRLTEVTHPAQDHIDSELYRDQTTGSWGTFRIILSSERSLLARKSNASNLVTVQHKTHP